MIRRSVLSTLLLPIFSLCLPVTAPAQVAQESVDLSVVQRIREEGLERSHIEELAHYLTDVNGPRLTGSPGMKRANDWTAATFRGWGLESVTVEPWGEFGRGWEQVNYMGRILTPYRQELPGIPSAWTGSTDGTVRGHAVVVSLETVADVQGYAGKLKDAVLLIDAPQDVEPEWEHVDRRTSLDELLAPPAVRSARQFFEADRQARMERRRAQREVSDALSQLAQSEGALAILRISGAGDGVIRGGGSGSRAKGDPEGLPQVVIPREQYNQIWRNVSGGTPVELELLVTNRFYEDDLKAYNTLAEIPGTDKADEYVMLGGHLDSWHYGTGGSDNAAGSVVMMEAVRILKALGLEPRRTVRIALWSGEEQGLLGSRAWVANHPEMHAKISAYVNVDNGTGKIRGIWDQSNERAIPVFEQILWPFRDLGVVAVKHGDTGGTDHLSFDAAGIPGFNFIQDPIEYNQNVHHTNLDNFDHLQIEDLKQAAVVVAATVYALAQRDEMMPRKSDRPVSN
ncbi:MAG TPA: M20/M25/M40 family metallo-hydrolase [Longimicrobiales bacterium]|nr:M20/M25/M40 family metallo-hydrolase [Longimicrobiales bacterium]